MHWEREKQTKRGKEVRRKGKEGKVRVKKGREISGKERIDSEGKNRLIDTERKGERKREGGREKKIKRGESRKWQRERSGKEK